jgi:hypothetical protein
MNTNIKLSVVFPNLTPPEGAAILRQIPAHAALVEAARAAKAEIRCLAGDTRLDMDRQGILMDVYRRLQAALAAEEES